MTGIERGASSSRLSKNDATAEIAEIQKQALTNCSASRIE
jgi:hypothetical protein